MRKIASPQELTQELRSLLAQASAPNPSRIRLASALSHLAERIGGEDEDGGGEDDTRTASVSKGTRKGARVRFTGGFYSRSPEVGEEGTVGTMPGFGSRTYLPGPGGGLLYVNWDESGMIGVSPNDLEKVGQSERVASEREGAAFNKSWFLDPMLRRVFGSKPYNTLGGHEGLLPVLRRMGVDDIKQVAYQGYDVYQMLWKNGRNEMVKGRDLMQKVYDLLVANGKTDAVKIEAERVASDHSRRVQAAKRHTTKRDITSKRGVTVAKDAVVTLSWKSPTGQENASVARITDSSGNVVSVSTENLSKYVTGVGPTPSINTMTKWSRDGVARSVLGARVEPDGWDPDDSPSWLLALGMM